MATFCETMKYSNRVELIDAGRLGTIGIRAGCIPSDLLISEVEAGYWARHAEAFGIGIDPIETDGRSVMRWVRAERVRVGGVVRSAVEIFN